MHRPKIHVAFLTVMQGIDENYEIVNFIRVSLTGVVARQTSVDSENNYDLFTGSCRGRKPPCCFFDEAGASGSER